MRGWRNVGGRETWKHLLFRHIIPAELRSSRWRGGEPGGRGVGPWLPSYPGEMAGS